MLKLRRRPVSLTGIYIIEVVTLFAIYFRERGTHYRAVLQARFVTGGGREMEGRGSKGIGWMAVGTGRLGFLF